MSDKIVSIIIPAWNAEAYVREAVGSALAQTYSNVEVILVDDGSTDGTKDAVGSFCGDKRFRYIREENKGLAGARNMGIRESRGALVALLDSDDAFMPEKIERQVRALETHPDFGVCYSDLIHFTDTEPRQFYHHRYSYPSGDILTPLLRRQFLNPLAVLARREIFEKYGMFDESLRRSEDWDLWLRWAHAGVKFFYLDEPLAYYRMRTAGNLSAVESEPAMKEKNVELFERFGKTLGPEERERYRFDDILALLRKKLAFAYLLIGEKGLALDAARTLSPWFRGIIRVLPGGIWRSMLRLMRKTKHRLLLRRISKPLVP